MSHWFLDNSKAGGAVLVVICHVGEDNEAATMIYAVPVTGVASDGSAEDEDEYVYIDAEQCGSA